MSETNDPPRCSTHNTVLLTRFDETTRPGLMIPTDERYCPHCEREQRVSAS